MAINKKDLDEVPVFAICPPSTPFPDGKGGELPTLIVGVPIKCFRRMQNGKTSTFALEKAGMPIRLIMFGAPDHETAYNTLIKWNADNGFVSDVQLHKDFGISEPAGPPTDELRGAGGGAVPDQQQPAVPVKE